MTREELIAIFQGKPLQATPGTTFNYSNSNWILLAEVLSKIGERDYAALLQERIFNPAGMSHSGYFWSKLPAASRSVGYADTGTEFITADYIHENTMDAAGAIYSTVDDLWNWTKALKHLVTPAAFQTMILPVTPQYAYGWECHVIGGKPAYGHTGGIPGYVSNLIHLPSEDLTVIMLSNLGSAAYQGLVETLAQAVLGLPYAMPSAYTFINVPLEVLTRYVGTYQSSYAGRPFKLNMVLNGDQLEMHISGLTKSVLKAISDTRFYARSKGEVDMTFTVDEQQQVNGIDMNWDGSMVHATRLMS